MKKLGFILMACALIMGASQCKKNNESNKPENNSESVFITLNVGGSTRANVVPEEDIAPVYYAEGDMIHVVSNGHYIGTLTYNGTNFSGDITNPTDGQPLHFYFLGNVTPTESMVIGETSSCSVIISDQTTSHPVISYAPSNQYYSAATTNYTATLLNKCALVKFNVTTASDAATCILGMNNKVTVDFATNEFDYSQEGEGVITLAAGNGEKWVILLPQDALEEGEEGSAYSEDGNYTGIRGSVPAITNNGFHTNDVEVIVGGHAYIDLGLPSGILWATCNIGANAPEEYGDYFAWGETQPKDYYDWSTYLYANGTSDQDPQLTKYCSNANYGYNGFTDNLTTLLPEDDAATANWGSGWRMPTEEEIRELYNNTTMTWTQQNGVNGRLFTATNGNNLFLPFAGYHSNDELNYAGNLGYCWSSSLYSDSPYGAWSVYFISDYYFVGYSNRLYGFPVRPVRSASQN